MAIAAAWVLVVAADVTGNAAVLSHDALIEDGPPVWMALNFLPPGMPPPIL